MPALFGKDYLVLFLLLSIYFEFVIAQEEKCNTIEHCQKCPVQDKCEICENGFKLNEEGKCIEMTNPSGSSVRKSSSAQQQNNPSGSSARKSSSPQPQNNPSGSSTRKSSSPQPQNNPSGSSARKSSSAQKASNSPIPSNQETLNLNKEIDLSNKGTIYKIIIYIVIGIVVLLCLRWLCLRKKSHKTGYFYDENGNIESKAKVVYIQ